VIEIIHLSEPDFYATYKETRKVVDLGGAGSNVLKGTVVDADTKTAIEGATVAFMHKNSTVVILTKLSAAKGGFIDKTLEEGDYTVTISKVGYKTMTTYVTVDYSKTISMAIVLSKNND
jgi:TolB protein